MFKNFGVQGVIVLAQLLLVQSFAVADSPIGPGDTRPVEIRLGTQLYNIPRNYLMAYSKPTPRNTHASFTLYVLLPELSPRTAATAAALNLPGWHDQLRALVEYGSSPRPRKDLLKFYLGLANVSQDDFELVGGRYKKYYLEHNSPHEIFTADTPNGMFLFTCNRASDFNTHITPYCTVMENIGANVGIHYSFGRDHLLEALEIDQKLRRLLTSFVEK